jgi:hypothetical protein
MATHTGRQTSQKGAPPNDSKSSGKVPYRPTSPDPDEITEEGFVKALKRLAKMLDRPNT